jgi:hypothetical protein
VPVPPGVRMRVDVGAVVVEDGLSHPSHDRLSAGS